jgi:hypothetical protein
MVKTKKTCKRCSGKLTYNPISGNGMTKGWYCETCGEYQPKGKGA